ncbi:GNAT family N-acetyltransferase [Algirhabdus cladophorae]|uniref:GNAT family N-acetyltransferase n=1 Tax=Algirhabdus cladophorae TaxID=3377108 RepID=UPI003B847716
MIAPTLHTDRLILRAPTEADFEAEVGFWASERSHFVGGPMTREQGWRGFASLLGHWHIRGYGFWAVEEKATGKYCGRVGLWNPEGWPEAEIGWTLMDHAEGRGIAHEAALESRRYAYQVLDWDTAISCIDPNNTRSAALAQKLGATYDYDYTHERYGQMQVWRHPSPEALT